MPAPAEQSAPVFLVAYGTGPMSDAQLYLACRSANDIGGIVRVLHVVERSRHIPLTTPLTPEEEAQVQQVLDQAEQIVTPYHVACHLDAVRASAVGPAIITAAQEHQAHMIFLGLRDRDRPHASLPLSGTVRHVLQNAQCPVQIGYLPAGVTADRVRTERKDPSMGDQSEAFDALREALDHLYVRAREQVTAHGIHERRWTLLADKIEEASLYAARGAQEAASVEEILQAPTPVAVPPTPDSGHASHSEENR